MTDDSQAAAGPTGSAVSPTARPIPTTPQPTSQSTAPGSAASLETPEGTAALEGATVDGVRFFEPRDSRIEKATDLGSVQVLKHGNRFLLTDSFGDIHPDSRGLGLYQGDTRVLSCSVLRVGGVRPVLLQTSVGANFRGGIQMTNPSADRNPQAKTRPDGLVGRTVGISRDRLIGAEGVSERLRIVNHGGDPAEVAVDLELGADGADIFEVRGYPRRARGQLLPAAATDRRVTFRYVGLDSVERLTHLAFSEAAAAVEPVTEPLADGSDTERWITRLNSS